VTCQRMTRREIKVSIYRDGVLKGYLYFLSRGMMA